MADKYICKKCKAAGSKKLIPYKIIFDDNGESIKFVGNLCERCFKEIFEAPVEPAPTAEEKSEESHVDCQWS